MSWREGVDFLLQYSLDFAELENIMWAYCIGQNRKAKRLPARLRKRKYGKSKKPYQFIHDCIICNEAKA